MSVQPIGDGKPLPASMSDAFDRWLEWYRSHSPDLSAAEIELFMRIFYSGAVAAAHQLNAGRYLATATFLNSIIYKNAGLTEAEKVQYTDAALDGSYPFPEGYPDGSPFGIKMP